MTSPPQLSLRGCGGFVLLRKFKILVARDAPNLYCLGSADDCAAAGADKFLAAVDRGPLGCHGGTS